MQGPEMIDHFFCGLPSAEAGGQAPQRALSGSKGAQYPSGSIGLAVKL
jgi:hypothetical protein